MVFSVYAGARLLPNPLCIVKLPPQDLRVRMGCMTTKQQWFSSVKRTLVGVGALGAAMGAFLARESTAEAQARFGDKGQLAITGENLFRFGTERYGENVANLDESTTVNRFGFLYSE